MKKTLKLGGVGFGGDDWKIVYLNDIPIGEIMRFSDKSIHIHNYLGERGNQMPISVDTLRKGMMVLANEYVEEVFWRLAFWQAKAKEIGAQGEI